MKKIIGISSIIIVIDIITKLLIDANMDLNSSITVINNFLNITYVHNFGAAFSILIGARIILIIISLIVLYFIYRYLQKEELNNYNIICYGFLIGGIIGNLIDRIVYGYVIDFLSFKIINYNFPVFNVADIFITLGTFMFLIRMVRSDLKCKK